MIGESDPILRDRLKIFCAKNGLVMSRFVSMAVTRALDQRERPNQEVTSAPIKSKGRLFLK